MCVMCIVTGRVGKLSSSMLSSDSQSPQSGQDTPSLPLSLRLVVTPHTKVHTSHLRHLTRLWLPRLPGSCPTTGTSPGSTSPTSRASTGRWGLPLCPAMCRVWRWGPARGWAGPARSLRWTPGDTRPHHSGTTGWASKDYICFIWQKYEKSFFQIQLVCSEPERCQCPPTLRATASTSPGESSFMFIEM